MLRRTVHNFLETIGIKAAPRESLFRYDNSQGLYYLTSKLTTDTARVIRYIEEVERNRDQIIAKDDEDTLKIRARVIVGRDGDEKHQKGVPGRSRQMLHKQPVTLVVLGLRRKSVSYFGANIFICNRVS